MHFDLKSKTAVVTGSTAATGRPVAELATSRGVADRSPAQA